MIGSGLLLVALMLLVLAFVWRRPSKVASRPRCKRGLRPRCSGYWDKLVAPVIDHDGNF